MYLGAMALPYALLTIRRHPGALPPATLLAWFFVAAGGAATRRVFLQTGPQLNAALAETGQTGLLYAALFAVGVLLAH